MSKLIPITCEPTGAELRFEHMIETQGNLKDLSTDNYNKLKNSMIENGFMVPFFVWHKNNGKDVYMLDGHQRKRTIEAMKNEGFEFPNLFPVVRIKATSLHDAKKKLLLITSQYGKITGQGLYEYICEGEIDVNFLDGVEYDSLDMDMWNKEFIEDPFNEEENKNSNKEIDINDIEDGLKNECPKCGFRY